MLQSIVDWNILNAVGTKRVCCLLDCFFLLFPTVCLIATLFIKWEGVRESHWENLRLTDSSRQTPGDKRHAPLNTDIILVVTQFVHVIKPEVFSEHFFSLLSASLLISCSLFTTTSLLITCSSVNQFCVTHGLPFERV